MPIHVSMHIHYHAYSLSCIFIIMHIHFYAYSYLCIFLAMHVHFFAYSLLYIFITMHIHTYSSLTSLCLFKLLPNLFAHTDEYRRTRTDEHREQTGLKVYTTLLSRLYINYRVSDCLMDSTL